MWILLFLPKQNQIREFLLVTSNFSWAFWFMSYWWFLSWSIHNIKTWASSLRGVLLKLLSNFFSHIYATWKFNNFTTTVSYVMCWTIGCYSFWYSEVCKRVISIHIQVSDAHSWTCMDLYVFATPYRVTWDYYFLSREHTLEFKEWEGKLEYEYVSSHFP